MAGADKPNEQDRKNGGKPRRTTPVRENPGEPPDNLRKREEWFRKRSAKP